jgi:hypothetical protein
MSTPNTEPVLGALPGTYLTERQGQRAEALRFVTVLLAGRGVPYGSLWAIARWVYDGSDQ